MTDDRIMSFAEATNHQVRASNRSLLAMYVSAFVFLFPKASDSGRPSFDLPFALGSLPEGQFEVVALVLQAILTLVFCQSYVGLMDVAKTAHGEIRTLDGDEGKNLALYNAAVVSGFTKISFLTNGSVTSERRSLRIFGIIYYSLLNLVTAFSVGLLPLAVLVQFYCRVLKLEGLANCWIAAFSVLSLAAVLGIGILLIQIVRYFVIALAGWGFLPERFKN